MSDLGRVYDEHGQIIADAWGVFVESDHIADALVYGLMAASWPKPPPRPWHVRQWRRIRWWLHYRLRDLADWVRP
jgi:hypothetical protein